MNSRTDRWFSLLLFALIACGIAFAAYVSKAPLPVKVAVFVFPLAAFSAIGYLVWGEIDRYRVGPLRLRVPDDAGVGSTIKVGLRVENPQLAERIATFTLVCERFGRGNQDRQWREVWSTAEVATVVRGMLTAEASMQIPRNAEISKADELRWQLRATIVGYERAKFVEEVNVRRTVPGMASDFAGANELLDQPRLESLEFETAAPPASAVSNETKTQWLLVDKALGLRIVGVALIGFATFWLWMSTSAFRQNFFAEFDAQSPFSWGQLLFQVPFVLVGIALEVVGIAMLLVREQYEISSAGVAQELVASSLFKRRALIAPNEVLALRVLEVAETPPYLALAVLTKRGVLKLPIKMIHAEAMQKPDQFRQHARWLADVIGRRDLAFDANPMRGVRSVGLVSLFSKSGAADEVGKTPHDRLKVLRAISGGMAILGFGGFALMFLGGIFGERTSPSPKKPSAPMESATASFKQAREEARFAAVRDEAGVIDASNCGYEDKSYCDTLIFATRSNQHKRVAEMLAKGAKPHERDGNGWSPWAYALSRGNAATISAFLDAEVPARGIQDLPFNGTQRQSVPPLIFALGHGNADAIQTLIKRGADPAERGPYGYPAANFAAYYGNVAALKALKESGVDLLAATPPGLPHDGETFLMHAAEGGKPAAVDYLLSLGANPSQRDPRGKTAADHAKAYGHVALAERLWELTKQ